MVLALGVCLCLSAGSLAGSITDADSDGIPDNFDNCINYANGPLGGGCHAQQDTDEDGFGNACDGDFDNDDGHSLADILVMIPLLNTPSAEHDLDCDGAVSLVDVTRIITGLAFEPGFSSPLGSGSGLPCAVANQKGTCPPL